MDDGTLLSDRRGQSETIGAVLLIALVIMGTGAVVVFGSQAVEETQQSATVSRVEHSMTLFDSRSAMVALGGTNSQQMQFAGVGTGVFSVEPDSGWMQVRHLNYTGNGDNETIYNASLGSVRYTNDRTTIAYQGGGVWRAHGNGSTMISPPEFHYRQATLTLPVIQIAGKDSATGRTTVVVESTQKADRIFPNQTTSTDDGIGAPYDVTDDNYRNPVMNGTVMVTVHSQYYRGWAKYFRTRTDGNVTVNHSARTAIVELTAPGMIGDFQMPSESNSIRAEGIAEGHSVENFNVTLDEGKNFNNMYFSLWAEEGGKEFELMIHVPDGLGQQPCKDGVIDEINHLELEVYYHNEGTPEGYHAWTNSTVDANNGSIRLECVDDGEEQLVADFTGDTNLTYDNFVTSEDYWYHTWDGTRSDHADFNHTEHGEPTRFTTGDSTTIDHLVNHYFAKFAPNMELTVQYGPGGSVRVDTTQSTGTLDYKMTEGGSYITFLHITENGIEVKFK